MKRKFLGFLISLLFLQVQLVLCQANLYESSLLKHREEYKKEFLSDKNSPLTKEDTAFLRFYPISSAYLIQTEFVKVTDEKGFDMQTHNGVIKKYFVYGYVSFTLSKEKCKLYIYQSEKLKAQQGMEDYLFIPFTDNTNYAETFGGGRYLDFRIKDIQNNRLLIDFNKCYNPYCAYKEGYACPIPPKENDLKIRIEAGEKLFGK